MSPWNIALFTEVAYVSKKDKCIAIFKFVKIRILLNDSKRFFK